MTPSTTVSRRGFGALLGVGLLAGCSTSTRRDRSAAPSSGHTARVTPQRSAYGTGAQQFGELYRPASPVHDGVIVLIHGGFWRAQYTLSLGAPLAADLAARGFTAWNLEYRRVGDGGGWPATLEDVAAGMDHLATLDVDTSRVVAVGHSAGGQLAVWAAGRTTLPAGSPGAAPRVSLRGAVSQAGVLDLRTAVATGVGGSAVSDFLGGAPAQVPDRYAVADPIERLPLDRPVLCVHGNDDDIVPLAQSTAYVEAAGRAGDFVRLDRVSGDHFTLIDPASQAWATVRDALPSLLVGSLPGT